MAAKSAGILLYRRINGLEVMLVHPGGPFWQKKDLGSWSIPKGEYAKEEDPLAAARREFEEETGFPIDGDFIQLKTIKQKAGKEVTAWAVEGDLDAEKVVSNTFDTEWPPKSGRLRTFPEVDRAAWFNVEVAREKINEKQKDLIEELNTILKGR